MRSESHPIISQQYTVRPLWATIQGEVKRKDSKSCLGFDLRYVIREYSTLKTSENGYLGQIFPHVGA